MDATLASVEQFEVFVNRPENAERVFELVAGEIVEVPSNPYASKIAARILGFIFMYLLENSIGHLTGADGGYQVGSDRYAPDVGFISYASQAQLVTDGYNPNPPTLAVEVVSSDTAAENATLTRKVANYMAAGTIVWVVRPQMKTVEVFVSGQTVVTHREDDTLGGGTALPNFELAINTIFDA